MAPLPATPPPRPAPPGSGGLTLPSLPNPISAAGAVASDVSGFVQALTQRSTWLRVGEALLGLALIGIGVSAIVKTSSAGTAAKNTAAKAVKFIK